MSASGHVRRRSKELERSGIPFLIATGFGSGDIDPELTAPTVGKPFDFELLEVKLQTILQAPGLRLRGVLGSLGGI